MIELNTTELFAANQIINTGLMKASDSLSFFMKQKISFLAQSEQEVFRSSAVRLSEKSCDGFLLLITEVIGEMKGLCCLVFSEDEANQLRKTALPEEIIQNPALMKEMSDAIMLEVDNIISAAVITQFANLLKKKIHGGIPRLLKVNYDELMQFVYKETENATYIIRFKTSFVAPGINFNPEFLWLFDQQFIESIRAFASEKENVEKLKRTNLQNEIPR